MAERIKYCRQCGTQMDQDAKFCSHCGYRFETTKGQKPAARFCPQCGNVISADEKFCPACGQRISKAAASAADPSPVSSQQNRDNQRYSQPVRNRQTSSYPSKPAPAYSGRSTASGIPKKKHPIIPIILGVVVLLLGFFYWVSSTTDGSQTEAKAPATTTQGSHTGTTPFGADSSNVQAASDAAPSFPSLEEYARELEADGNIEAAARVCALIPKTAASDLHEVAREEFPLIEKAQDLEQIRSVFGGSRRMALPDTADGSGAMETAVSDGSSDPRTPENRMSSENDTQGMPTGEELAAIAKELSSASASRGRS